MNQAPPDATRTKLQAALNSLDLSLETELQRYYRQRPAPITATATPQVAETPGEIEQPPTSQGADTIADMSLSPWQQSPPPPEDYLESSEELLKSLDLEAKAAPSKASSSRWKWALGLVGAGTLGAGLVALAIAVPDLFTPKTASDSTSETVTPEQTASAPPESATTPSPTVNLASQEFIELRLDNLSIVDPGVSPEESADSEDNLTTEAATPDATTIPAPPTPMTGFPGTPLTTPDGLKVGYYYVILRDTSPAALEQAKTVVKDASVRQFPVGQAIQLGEVESEAKAQALVNQLKAQKITAEVYFHQLSPAS